ncbi:MAG TPA: hypothetical protein DEQ87_12960 [Algoriphagus sp.]|jgi:hypothetical protein|uniref:hypothetical protein n=2 Tax=Algoriphagus TaxID=246875 RepID=UPI000C3E2F0D|nr:MULTISPECIES: hypothetical protein [unclassified Algoriphagus]MAL15431.1 hypothetical protein [Algoriphagus sp.]MAN86822.1 hypothetical protein [Algoriphagus sp.]QYH40377.1 hypothetical protein GYM62_16830 [Algoriphagus sp. NBT04N3]HCB45634.1 hypothetical protein [Algoriphagus sp.]HCD88527.1 hypothetical protein [Algoriphagus sp.]|tara:strand:+ start:1717 stop:3000 length:1284 start_codon:yes stop_codon:yes gene_type:complete
MLSKIKWHLLGVCCTFILFSEAQAQSSASTYSALGIGEFNYSGLTQNQGMGGLGISFGTGWNANVVNPALQTRNTIFNFQTSLNYRRINASNGSQSSDVDGGGLSYIALSLPFKPGKLTMGMGLNQVTSVNYDLQISSMVNNAEIEAVNNINGDGGISEAYISAGYLLAKNLSIGVHGSYLFGSTIRKNQLTLFNENGTQVGSTSEYYERLTISDVALKFGTHYYFKVGEKSNLHVGAIYQGLGDVNGSAFAKLAAFGEASDPDTEGDLILDNEKGSIYIPSRYGFGVSYERVNKYVIGLEGQYQNFSDFRNFLGDPLELREAIKLGLGFQIVPDFMSVDNNLKRGTYRVGLEFLQTPYYINQTTINDLGINFGASIPVNQLSLMNLAVKVGQRGTTSAGLIRENYVNFTLGFSLNDNTWFYKRVFE